MSLENKINFFKEEITFRFADAKRLRKWITKVFKAHKFEIEMINYIFCSDRYLRKINKQFLNHDYLTDIITFDNSTIKGKVQADIYISIDRIRINSKTFNTTFSDELHRVIVHGALHLTGFKDKTPKDQKKMKEAEELWLLKRF